MSEDLELKSKGGTLGPGGRDVNRGVLQATYETAEIHDRWEAIYRKNPLQDRLNDKMMDRIMAYLRPRTDALFLDAGCGVGDHSVRIARRGHRCVGIDLSHSILRQAAWNVARNGLEAKITLSCQPLENLSFPDGTFDHVHCRGVLMHIPNWETALASLCRVLKPGGRIVILEANDAGLDAGFVRLARLLLKRKSKMVTTPGGLEFWSEDNGVPFVARIANVPFLLSKLRQLNVRPIARFATEFLEIGRLPAGMLRNAAILLNGAWFSLRLPANISTGNAIIGEKL